MLHAIVAINHVDAMVAFNHVDDNQSGARSNACLGGLPERVGSTEDLTLTRLGNAQSVSNPSTVRQATPDN